MKNPTRRAGFTIVELLIVVVIIAVLAAITIVSYNGIQTRARASKMNSDIAQLNKAIIAARQATGKTLAGVTGASSSYVTSDACGSKTSGTDLAALPRTDECWVNYKAALSAISTESQMNVNNLVDPWGRPYMVYEHEGRATPTTCTKDLIGPYQQPFVQWAVDYNYAVNLSNTLPGC